MKILIHGKNIELTGALKEYTESKITKATHHYKDIVKEADIHLSIEKNPRVSFQSAEVTIFFDRKMYICFFDDIFIMMGSFSNL